MNNNDRKVYVVPATYGFKGYIWQVRNGGDVVTVNACDNYTAVEACGWKFAGCEVEEMVLISADDLAKLHESNEKLRREVASLLKKLDPGFN